jgi:hypothetical protein
MVRDLTSDGARLHFANTMPVPELFEMSFDNYRSAAPAASYGDKSTRSVFAS